MKRWLWLAAGLAMVLAVGSEQYRGQDVGELKPVQVVRILSEDDRIIVETDVGAWGDGETVAEAFETMEKTASGRLFWDTAEYLLIDPGCEAVLEEMWAYLRPSCSVCVGVGEMDLTKVGGFLRTHPPKVTLAAYRAGDQELALLRAVDGRMELE